MHLVTQLELLYILRISPEPAEGDLAEALDPVFLAAKVGPVDPSILAGGLAAPAREQSPKRGCTLVNVGARQWPKHGAWRLVVGRPHKHP